MLAHEQYDRESQLPAVRLFREDNSYHIPVFDGGLREIPRDGEAGRSDPRRVRAFRRSPEMVL